jgi:hypothetical protein
VHGVPGAAEAKQGRRRSYDRRGQEVSETIGALDRALHGIDGAGELDHHTVTGGLEDPTLMFGDQRIEHILASDLSAARVPASSVSFHQPTISDYIGGQDGSKAALGAFFGHLKRFLVRSRDGQIVWAPHRGVYRIGVRCGSEADIPAALLPCPLRPQ